MRLKYNWFWPGFNPTDFFITKYYKNAQLVDLQDINYDILILSVFPNNVQFTVNPNAKIVIFNGEHPSYIERYNISPTLLIGFSSVDSSWLQTHNNPKQINYPLWITYYENITPTFFEDVNKLVKTNKTTFNKKKLACLVNSHDMNRTRTPIYNFINKYERVDCPGKLYNNMDSKVVGTTPEDKRLFISNYKFNICCENKRGINYCTEKIIQSIEAGCIPIYYGYIDEFTTNIINKDRIIFLETPDDVSAQNKIKELIEDESKFYSFYKQPAFLPNAYSILMEYKEKVKNEFKSC